MRSLIQHICEVHALILIKSTPVSGGDINQAFKVETKEGLFLLKINSASHYPQMFQKEADGLQALQKASTLKIPSVIAVGECDSQQYLLLEWLDRGEPHSTFWDEFAVGLTQQHRCTNDKFGWSSNNYIGSLEQSNTKVGSWAEFYEHQRIIPLVSKLIDNSSFDKGEIKNAETLCKKFPEIFRDEPPSLLHGDLWSGNYMAALNKENKAIAAFYDPAIYYGHREMDLGMSLLFGGFNQRFYEVYNSTFPLEAGWRKRVPITQLYPLLVHAVLFGGSYVRQCCNTLAKWA